jgi:membrane protein DedA with SNARE-associated domain
MTSLLEHYGYFALFGLVFIESFGVPAPGETTIIAAAVFAGNGHLNVVVVALVAFAAAVIGDSLGYLIGRKGGRPLILRVGKYIHLTPQRLERVESFMDRQGPKVVAIARFIEGLRQFNGIVAGATGMHWPRFLMFNSIGAAVWVTVWTTAGYLAGDHIDAIEATIARYQWYAIAALVVGLAGWLLWRRRHRKTHPADEPPQKAKPPVAG